MKKVIILNLIFFLTVSTAAISQTRLVPDEYSTIQAAIDDAVDGDEVIVAPGTYTGDGNRDINFNGKAITVRGTNPDNNSVVESTIIDCQGTRRDNHRGFIFDNNENHNSVLSGITITNGNVMYHDSLGGAIYCNESSPIISKCRIINNEAAYGGGIGCVDSNAIFSSCLVKGNCTEGCSSNGGGIYCKSSCLLIERCIITENDSRDRSGGGILCDDSDCVITQCLILGNKCREKGGGIACLSRSNTEIISCTVTDNRASDGGGINCQNGTITNCIITDNYTDYGGGGICCSSNTVITNCTICDNSSKRGGGIYCRSGKPSITNCTICNNSSERGGGICCRSGNPSITNCTICDNYASDSGGGVYGYRSDSNPSITNCIIWGNIAPMFPQLLFYEDPTYSCIQNWNWGGEGNITENPYLTFGTNYHPMPYSPCIDTGTNEPIGGLPPNDLDGNPRPLDGDGDGIAVADMGAYEFREPNTPLIAFIPIEFEIHHYIGFPNPQPQRLSIWNAGPGTLCWEIIEDCNWLDVSPTSGQSSGQYNEVTLTVDGSGLDPCSYSCILTITDPNGSDWIRYIPVNLIVSSVLLVPIQYPTIQAAIDAANDYDMVLVDDGIYTGDGNRDLDFRGKLITVKSANGPNNCIIDCNGSENDPHRAFYFHNDETAKSIVDGFTLTNGYARDGGGICCEDHSSPAITNCIFSGNSAKSGGALFFHMYLFEGNLTITNCTISGNTAQYDGGGIYCGHRNRLTLTNCTIIDNCASESGGGICCQDVINTTITNCTISGNSALQGGGGIYCHGGDTTITSCTISGNSVHSDLFILARGGGIYCHGGDTTIANCTISDNSVNSGTYGIPQGGGIGCHDGSMSISNCTITGNKIYSQSPLPACGGGIYCHGGDTTITRCTISDNSVNPSLSILAYGGGIYCGYRSNVTIISCKISGNSVHSDSSVWADGGGIYCHGSNTTITNCTIFGNSSTRGGGIYCRNQSNSNITNSILWNNIASDGPQIFLRERSNLWVSYTDIEGGQGYIYISPDSELNWGLGNIDSDPCFVEAGYWADVNDSNIIVEPNDPNAVWIDGDYHLLENSPCINAGDPNYTPEPDETDLDGNPRVIVGRIDMGAYEFNPPIRAEMKITPKTLNCKSKGNWVKAHFVLPEGFTSDDVDINEPAFAELLDTEIDSEYVRILGSDDGPVRLEIAFDRQAFCDLLTDDSAKAKDDSLEITVVGFLTTSRYFYGCDTIRIKRSHRRW